MKPKAIIYKLGMTISGYVKLYIKEQMHNLRIIQ